MGMSSKRRRGIAWRAMAVAGCVAGGLIVDAAPGSAAPAPTNQYVVADAAGAGAVLARMDVWMVGGRVDTDLASADAVLADLTPFQVTLLQRIPTVSVTPNLTVTLSSGLTTASGAAPAAVFPEQSGATTLWSKGDSGSGVNVAVVDTGIDPLPDFAGRLLPGVDLSGEGNPTKDSFGHGTFVAGLIAGDGSSSDGLYKGEAPGAGLVPVKVAGADGSTNLARVIAGIDWVISHRVTEHIGVMNLSLGYVPPSSTVTDPLAQAVERAWDSGIVVVASAGNDGPYNGTVLSPGDDPLVITVGAVDDHGSSAVAGDTMAGFSSAGPTNPDGWLKPDLVTSGTSVVSLEAPGSTVATDNPQAVVGTANFVGSGTSFSSAVTSGAVALLLAGHPNLKPDAVKAALLGTTAPGPVGDPLVDGHGLLDVAAAANATGLQLQQHFGQLSSEQGAPGALVLSPGQTIRAGFTIQVPGRHPWLSSSVSGGELSIPVACRAGGAAVDSILIDLPTASYQIPAGWGGAVPLAGITQESTTAPDLCQGGPMYGAGAGAHVSFSGALISTDLTDRQNVQAVAVVGASPIRSGVATAVGVAPTEVGDSVDLSSTWAASTWNTALWHGLPASVRNDASAALTATGSSGWTGADWNGQTWDGHAWNGHAWNGHAWNGHAWNGAAWDGHAWNGSAWAGHAWNGAGWGTPGAS